jgi:hypothetical protein
MKVLITELNFVNRYGLNLKEKGFKLLSFGVILVPYSYLSDNQQKE